MNLLSYIKGLLPSFSKNAITESCQMSQASIREHTLPAYVSAEQLFKGQKFKSKQMQDFSAVFAKSAGKGSANMVSTIKDRLENTLLILNLVSQNAGTIYSEVEANIALTYVKLTYLRLVESAEFANTYARKFLNYAYVLETAQAEEHVSVQRALAPAEVLWLENGFLDFCACMKTLGMDTKAIELAVSGMPDAGITEMTERILPSTMGLSKVDPFQMRHLSAAVNPFYYFGMLSAERQAKRYKGAKEELELLQLRKLNLEKLHDKVQDAKLQKEIDYLENRVSSLNFEINKMQEEYLNG
jgi:hypothetical protein